MELYNRRLLLLNEDEHEPSSTGPLAPPGLMAAPSSLLWGRPLNLQASSVLSPDVAYTILILLTALLLLCVISLYIRKIADDSATAVSSRRLHHHSSPSALCGGLDQTTVQSLPVFAYHGESTHLDDCAICLSEFENGEALKMIPNCKHVFHSECIDTWLFSHVTCPICRGRRFFTVERCAGLGKVEDSGDQGVSNHQEGSTVENGETRGETRVVRSYSQNQSQRRSSSCLSLRGTVVLPRTLSY